MTVRPDSFLVRPKDKLGNPVTMMVKPSSVTEMFDVGNPAVGVNAMAASFNITPASDAIGSKVIGSEVHNDANQDIGTIKHIAYTGPCP